MLSRTLLLAEAGQDKSADAIHLLLNTALLRAYGVQFDALVKKFTLVTDWCAVIPKFLGASVSPNISPLDERWMGCTVHLFNTVMNSTQQQCARHPELARVADDLKSLKTIVRIFKQSGLNSKIPPGYGLLQQFKTRFVTTYTVAFHFIEFASFVFALIDEGDSQPAKSAKKSIFSSVNHNGTVSLPAMQEILDAFGSIVSTQKYLEGSNYPTVHLVLPLLQDIYEDLGSVGGGFVDNGTQTGPQVPSFVYRSLCSVLPTKLREKVMMIHDFWLATTFLNPLFREFNFIPDALLRQKYRKGGRICFENWYCSPVLTSAGPLCMQRGLDESLCDNIYKTMRQSLLHRRSFAFCCLGMWIPIKTVEIYSRRMR